MTDQSFEARLARDLICLVDDEVRSFDARSIADRALVQRGAPRLAFRSIPRRWALPVLVALLAAALVAGLIAGQVVRPARADTYRAILLQPSDGHVVQYDGGPRSTPALDVMMTRVDGPARLVRRVSAAEVWDPGAVFELSGELNPNGWLVLYAFHPLDDTRGWAAVLLDLTDPRGDPILLEGFGVIGPRFGPSDLLAVTDGGTHRVRVLDLSVPDAPERVVSGVPFLGGGPDLVWAADGSGFLKRRDAQSSDLPGLAEIGTDRDEWGVVPLDGGPFRPGFPALLRRDFSADLRFRLDGERGVLTIATSNGVRDLGSPVDIPGALLSAQLSADAGSVWVVSREIMPDGSGALVASRVDPDGTVTQVRRVPEWSALAGWMELSPDDSMLSLTADVGIDQSWLARMEEGDPRAAGVPVDGRFIGWVTEEAAGRIERQAPD